MKHALPYLTLLIALILYSCNGTSHTSLPCETPACTEGVCTGDLLFVQDTAGMGLAIEQATGQYTHVGIFEVCDGKVYLWDATPSLGVVRRDLDSVPKDYFALFTLSHLNTTFDTVKLIERLHLFEGQDYDLFFEHDNGRVYCSELVYECFFDQEGNRIFEAQPMNFKAADGSMPQYWIHLFDSLGSPIPQGMPGTNPTDLHSSRYLEDFKVE